jgi:peptidoglycan/xylan/chitin deacetylase (PgdA/CDA1 family)
MLFLDHQSHFFRSFIGRIRAFRLPIHLEAADRGSDSAVADPSHVRRWPMNAANRRICSRRTRETVGGESESALTATARPAPAVRLETFCRYSFATTMSITAHGDMTWSADFLADDWTRINNSEVARRAISRIEARGKGILLLHDIHPRTVLALPEILNELKSRGYKIVHVVPAAADRPKTATSAQQWVVHPTPEQHTSPSQNAP